MADKIPTHITIPSAPRSTRGAPEVFAPYRPKEPAAVAVARVKELPAAARYEMEPALREWLRTQVKILAYWDSLPDSHFSPPMPPATRARDAVILSGLRRLLA